jgi:hypothetical protein
LIVAILLPSFAVLPLVNPEQTTSAGSVAQDNFLRDWSSCVLGNIAVIYLQKRDGDQVLPSNSVITIPRQYSSDLSGSGCENFT